MKSNSTMTMCLHVDFILPVILHLIEKNTFRQSFDHECDKLLLVT